MDLVLYLSFTKLKCNCLAKTLLFCYLRCF